MLWCYVFDKKKCLVLLGSKNEKKVCKYSRSAGNKSQSTSFKWGGKSPQTRDEMLFKVSHCRGHDLSRKFTKSNHNFFFLFAMLIVCTIKLLFFHFVVGAPTHVYEDNGDLLSSWQRQNETNLVKCYVPLFKIRFLSIFDDLSTVGLRTVKLLYQMFAINWIKNV